MTSSINVGSKHGFNDVEPLHRMELVNKNRSKLGGKLGCYPFKYAPI
ncbi:hypothetical protein Q4557_02095 [Shewanella sp. 5_MG-2023]|nr:MULTISPECIES: hypothetical protein [unclassified Shewanella]MDO6638753.1 hypothetical protein [Shewanella sp. 5_MG-2023]MDO6677108.1 hypothetical protein [Shewanella sp. 4_MG-2023]MDO6773771.1 hypothetical protein [Shewanella sp. 3_MG-2023]